MARIALKVDVDTLRGTREGVPRLLGLLEQAGVAATFLFSVGPDHTGWAIRRVFRRGFLSKVSRTSILSHYGARTLMYGVLLPAPDIGRMAAVPMRETHRAGHECGIHAWDHVVWQDNVRNAKAAWTRHQMSLAFDRFGEIFGTPPATHGAAGWQMNAAAFDQIEAWGMDYASDTRGAGPYRPSVDGKLLAHVQLPTTLPTLDEMIGTNGIDTRNVVRTLLDMTQSNTDQVYTLHAELEGGLLAPAFHALLSGWRAQGHELVSLGALHRLVDPTKIPTLPLTWGSVPGRSGELVVAPRGACLSN